MVRVTKDSFKLSREDIPLIDFQVCTTIFNIAAEVLLCHAIKVLDCVENVGLLVVKVWGLVLKMRPHLNRKSQSLVWSSLLKEVGALTSSFSRSS